MKFIKVLSLSAIVLAGGYLGFLPNIAFAGSDDPAAKAEEFPTEIPADILNAGRSLQEKLTSREQSDLKILRISRAILKCAAQFNWTGTVL